MTTRQHPSFHVVLPPDEEPPFYGESQNERLNQMPARYHATYRKAMSGRSLRAAVNAHCLECVAWEREEVRLCTAPGCPLYHYRPYQ